MIGHQVPACIWFHNYIIGLLTKVLNSLKEFQSIITHKNKKVRLNLDLEYSSSAFGLIEFFQSVVELFFGNDF